MRICLVSSEHSSWGGIGYSLRELGTALARDHEVTLIHSGLAEGASPALPADGVREIVADSFNHLLTVSFSSEGHRRSAAVLEAIEAAYDETAPPDYVEVSDYLGHGLVTLQARAANHPLLRRALIAVRLASAAEIIALHDGVASAELRFAAAMEREQLRLADRVVWRGGDTLDLYRRHYADLELPEAVLVRPPLAGVSVAPPAPTDPEQPLRLLYVGRLQRVKGTLDLVEACMGLPRDDWRLTMIGADTATAPLGASVREAIEAVAGDDPRVCVEQPLPHEELQRRWAEHDLLVIPSRFEVWSNVAAEGMRAGLPILATPVGGPSEIVEPERTGWLADDVGPVALRRALESLLERREEVARVRASGEVQRRLRELTDPGQTLAAYRRLAAASRTPSPSRPRAEPPVTGIVPYHRAAEHIEEAVSSLLAQTHRNLDVIVVNDGSFEPRDEVLERLAEDPRVTVVTQINHGEPSARNLAALLARGEYLVMLDADNAFEPQFVARALEAVSRNPDLAYVTCWLTLVEPDGTPMLGPSAYAPLGNTVLPEDSANWDGDALALLPRWVFERGHRYAPEAGVQSDWELYRTLRADGLAGAVIPERLARYRVRSDSLSQTYGEATQARIWDEALGRITMRGTRWTASG